MLHIPQWLKDRENNATADAKYRKRTQFLKTRYFVRSLALICDEEGSLRELGNKLGLDYGQICKLAASNDSVLSAEIAKKMEKVAGRKLMPLSLLRPDLFE